MSTLPKTLFRNYDIRAEYGKELTEAAAYQIARGYAAYSCAKKVVVGRDARVSSPSLAAAVIEGLLDSGVAVVDIGMSSTDVLYFATWHGKYEGGLMITASHMPGKYNGIKFLRLNDEGMVVPIGRGLGMEELEIAANAAAGVEKKPRGVLETGDVWSAFVQFVRSFADVNAILPLRVVMDAGNGMGGMVARHLYTGMNLDMTQLFFEPDGMFPNHEPNPSIPENRADAVAAVIEKKADLGVMWDADCDRSYFIDEKGQYVNGDFITALLAIAFLRKSPGAGIVYDLRSSWAVKDWVEKLGGTAYDERVGHTYIKARMRATKSVFGGEISGHYYFSANGYMDNGFIPSMIIMEMMSKEKKTLSQLIADLGPYYVSGEINFDVADVPSTLARIEKKYGGSCGIDTRDGVSVIAKDWHANIRPSANDPVLRLNLEAKSKELLDTKFEEVRGVIVGE